MNLFDLYHHNLCRMKGEDINIVSSNTFAEVASDHRLFSDLEPGDVIVGKLNDKPVIVIREFHGNIFITRGDSERQFWVYARLEILDFLTKPLHVSDGTLVEEEALRFIMGRHTNGEDNFIVRVINFNK